MKSADKCPEKFQEIYLKESLKEPKEECLMESREKFLEEFTKDF